MISSLACRTGRAGIIRQLNKICQPGEEPLETAALALWLRALTSLSGASALLAEPNPSVRLRVDAGKRGHCQRSPRLNVSLNGHVTKNH